MFTRADADGRYELDAGESGRWDVNFSFAPLQPGNWFVWLGEDASQVLGEVANLSALEERDLGTLVAP